MTTSSKFTLPAFKTVRKRGYTLVEIMVAVSLLALFMGSMIPSFTFFTKSISGLGNYSIMSQESRSALERYARDLHTAESLTTATSNQVTMVLPDEFNNDTVTYLYDSDKKTVTRTQSSSSGADVSKVLFEDVSFFKMVYYNRLGVDISDHASILTETKSVQVNAKLLKKVIVTETTDYIISARFLMRNI
ncbi:pilus assembly FimT family protein [Coraliomargarita parva]|uniref:pilus assembly FimT family protein n=1 Tax=Coraliomargarita parva TaxID=3014050 RepID=UPI0022B404D7|nr:type II secretion system protein [Coraliomargarita parva]